MLHGHGQSVTTLLVLLKFMTGARWCDTRVGTKPARLMFIDSKAYIGCYYFKAVWEGLKCFQCLHVCARVPPVCMCTRPQCLFVSHKKQISENTEVK